jgi:hypothetical protein
MEEAWKIEKNPFPVDAIRIQNEELPYSPEVFPQETNAFRRKLIRGSVYGGQPVGFLWSQGVRADTGFGETTVMQQIAREINQVSPPWNGRVPQDLPNRRSPPLFPT